MILSVLFLSWNIIFCLSFVSINSVIIFLIIYFILIFHSLYHISFFYLLFRWFFLNPLYILFYLQPLHKRDLKILTTKVLVRCSRICSGLAIKTAQWPSAFSQLYNIINAPNSYNEKLQKYLEKKCYKKPIYFKIGISNKRNH